MRHINVTRLIREEDISTFLTDNFTMPSIQFPPLKAHPRTSHYAKVGQAFDYLLRFYIERKTGIQATSWVADFAGNVGIPPDEEEEQAKQDKALLFLERAHKSHEKYLQNGIITYGLLRACLDLALLDKVLREGDFPNDIGLYDRRDMEDLQALYLIIPEELFSSQDILLNPAIRTGKTGVVGDVDLCIDSCLIDIKTTKNSVLTREMYHQVLVYYLFASHYGLYEKNDEQHEKRKYTNPGIYFSRHAFLATIDIKALCKSSLSKVKTDFIHLLIS